MSYRIILEPIGFLRPGGIGAVICPFITASLWLARLNQVVRDVRRTSTTKRPRGNQCDRQAN